MEKNFIKVKRVLWILLFANLFVAALKLIMGTLINSASMTADGFHSLSDGSSNVVGLIGIKLASKPIDEDHPYGHRKFEMLAGLFISLMLIFVSGRVIVEAVMRLIHPVQPQVSSESLFILLFSLSINLFICIFEYKNGKKLNSQILISDSMHTRSDIYVSIGVLITLAGLRFGLPAFVDPLASFVVAGFIFHAAFEIFRDNSSILLDKAVVDVDQVKRIAMSFDQVKGIHKVRSRGCQNDLYIDMHILTEPNLSVEESHELAHLIEDKIKQSINRNVQLIAHLEPYNEKEVMEDFEN
ncbi:MAG: cation transporter [Clostridiales bacterium]|nr:cation transporter [Clostridiales bacterium]